MNKYIKDESKLHNIKDYFLIPKDINLKMLNITIKLMNRFHDSDWKTSIITLKTKTITAKSFEEFVRDCIHIESMFNYGWLDTIDEKFYNKIIGIWLKQPFSRIKLIDCNLSEKDLDFKKIKNVYSIINIIV